MVEKRTAADSWVDEIYTINEDSLRCGLFVYEGF